MSRARWVAVGALAAALLGGCGSRPGVWNVDPGGAAAVGLTNGVALVDDADHRVVILTGNSDQTLHSTPVSVGHSIQVTPTSADGTTLFVLAAGDATPTSGAGQPSLTLVQVEPSMADASKLAVTPTTFPMSGSCRSLAVDPLGHWAIAYQQVGFVENENELVIFDLTSKPGANNPVTRTIQSFGGTPQQFTFTPPLLVDPALGPASGSMVNGDRRLLIVQTEIDVTVLDLDHAFEMPPPPEITIPLTSNASTAQVTPAAVAVDGFSATSAADARFAVRASNSTDVFTFTFSPPADPSDPNDFSPVLNETDVGGVPSDMAFVRASDGSLGLAVLVPSSASAVLVQPDTSETSSVSLPQAYANMSLVTSSVSSGSNGDVALLWNGNRASGVALWTVGLPYFSISITGVSAPIQTVLDVPGGSPLKVLEPSDSTGFYVLDLSSQRVTPLTTTAQATLAIAPSGQRAWAYTAGGTDLASIDFTDFNPISVTTDARIASVFEIACADHADQANCQDLVALQAEGTLGATVFDANALLTVPPERVSALLLEAP